MKNLLFAGWVSVCLLSCSQKIYVVRHGERAGPADSLGRMAPNDPPLSEAGKVRALVLRDDLRNKHIRHIFSTKTVRTLSTAEPLSEAIHVSVDVYLNADSLVQAVLRLKGNTLIVGHSNTVNVLVNKLAGTTVLAGPLGDNEYDNLYVIRMKGKKPHVQRLKFGYPSNP